MIYVLEISETLSFYTKNAEKRKKLRLYDVKNSMKKVCKKLLLVTIFAQNRKKKVVRIILHIAVMLCVKNYNNGSASLKAIPKSKKLQKFVKLQMSFSFGQSPLQTISWYGYTSTQLRRRYPVINKNVSPVTGMSHKTQSKKWKTRKNGRAKAGTTRQTSPPPQLNTAKDGERQRTHVDLHNAASIGNTANSSQRRQGTTTTRERAQCNQHRRDNNSSQERRKDSDYMWSCTVQSKPPHNESRQQEQRATKGSPTE